MFTPSHGENTGSSPVGVTRGVVPWRCMLHATPIAMAPWLLSHPEAVAIHERGNAAVLLFIQILLESGEDLLLLHVRVTRDQRSEVADLVEPICRIGFHLVELVEERF